MIINHLLLGVTVVRTLDAIERLLGPSESITCIDAILSGIAFLDKGREICTLQVGDEVTMEISMDREVSCFTHDGIGFLFAVVRDTRVIVPSGAVCSEIIE